MESGNSIRDDYLALLEKIRKHDRAYYIDANPIISDFEYDQLIEQAISIEKKHPKWVTPDSPTQRVGESSVRGFQHIIHRTPMLSLSNTYSKKEVKEFIKRVYKLTNKNHISFCAELKVDGVAISVRYKRGVYTQAITRGDGKKGDDVTANVKTISSIPLVLDLKNPPDFLEIRGEVFMSHKAFRVANQKKEEEGEEPWANPRNAAAGSLKLLDLRETKKRNLSVIFYGISEESSGLVQSQFSSHHFLRKAGLPSFEIRHCIVAKTEEELINFAMNIEKERSCLGFDIDGVVIKVDDFSVREMVGVTGKSPRWAVAYKFAPEQATTKICEITVQVGRTGVLTPVAELEPVFLAGSTISRATLHNQDEIDRKDIRLQDTVIIEKGGDVIPKVVRVVKSKRAKESKSWKMPKRCPNCNSVIEHVQGKAAFRCSNYNCGNQILRRIIYFTSKNGMNIEHMGPSIVTQLVEKGLVKTFSDIYALTREKIALLEGFKEKSVQNLMESIEKSKQTSFPRLIQSLGIPYVGSGVAELLAFQAKNIETLSEMSKKDLMAIDGVGEKVATSLLEYFSNSENLKEIFRLISFGINFREVSSQKGHAFFEKSFVLTGSLDSYNRTEVATLIKERGGKVSNSVSKKTDYLLSGKDPGSKWNRAKALEIPILSEEEFKKLL